MHRSVWFGHFVVCTLVVFTGLAPAHAQPEAAASQPNANEYEQFVAEALRAYDDGRFAEARTSFRRAHELQPTARTLRTIGMCSFNLGDYLDALRNLDAALNESRKPLNAEQRDQVADLIARSQTRVGRFKIRLSPPDAALSVDGRQPPRLVSGEVVLEPGRHELTAEANGYDARLSTLQVEGGDRTTLEIRLERSEMPPVTSTVAPTSVTEAPVALSAGAETSPETKASTQAVLGYVALGIGGASLIGFGITTGLAAAKSSNLDEHCGDRRCGPAYHDDVDSYERYKLLSTITLIGAGAFAVAGTLLLITRPGETGEKRERASLTPRLGLGVGIGAIGLRGEL